MVWNLGSDDPESVRLVHDDGYRLTAQKRADGAGWRFEVADTVTGQELLRRSHRVSDDDHLWALLDDYAERYPP